MKIIRINFILLLFLINLKLFAKNIKVSNEDTILLGVVKGKVINASTEIPMANVTILYQSPLFQNTTYTDEKGNFKIYIPVGYEKLVFTNIGYKKNEIYVRSIKGSELYILVPMTETIENIPEVNIVVRGDNQNTSHNKMSLINSIVLNNDNIEKTSGVFSDPSRMLSNFAGIFNLSGEFKNDIIVRGNTPLGILWQIEGLKVANPNHFAPTGTNGGALPILNNNNLQNATFYTSAFLPEFGDAFSGVYDFTLKDGNYQKFQGYAQASVTGLELGMEGPLIKDKSSFLISYRYSITKLLEKIGINLFGGYGYSPEQQDLTFKTTLFNNKNGKLSFWGLGGLSNVYSDDKIYYKLQKTDYKLGILGLNYNFFLKDKHHIKLGVAFSFNSNSNNTFSTEYLTFKTYEFLGEDIKLNIKAEYLKKINNKMNIKTGVLTDILGINYNQKIYFTSFVSELLSTNEFGHVLIQPYFQTMYNFNNRISLSGGVNMLYFSLNNSFSVDPRLNFKWLIGKNFSFTFGTGLHSKLQPLITYFKKTLINQEKTALTNINLNFTKSVHATIGFNWNFAKNCQLINEYYFQYIYDVPVSRITENRNFKYYPAYYAGEVYINPSKFSMINIIPAYTFQTPDSLINGGTGNNYGTEISIINNFLKFFYVKAVGSLMNSRFIPGDGKVYNTLQNVNYIVNLNLGFETNNKKNKKIKINYFGDIRVSLMGGLRKRNILKDLSISQDRIYYDDENLYKDQYDPFSNINIRAGIRINTQKVSHLLAFDILNLFNTNNIYTEFYSINFKKITNYKYYQFPFIFSAQYRINFSFGKGSKGLGVRD